MPGLAAVVALAGGPSYVIAVLADGRVKAWGVNDYGQLGAGTLTRRTRPVLVAGASNVRQAHGGRGYSVVRRGALP